MYLLFSRRLRSMIAVIGLLAVAACDSAEERVQRHYSRGMALLADGSPERAVLEFRNALKINENHPQSRFEIARLYEADGEARAAMGNYRLVTELQPDHVEARVRLARMLASAGVMDEAARHVGRALELQPDNAEGLSVLATVQYRMGEPDAALDAARRALAVDPSLVGANVVVATALIDEGQHAAALDRLVQLSTAAPDETIYRLLKIRALEGLEDEDGVIAELETLATLQPREFGYREALVQLHLRRGDLDAAEAALRALASADSRNIERTLNIARFLIATGRTEAAETELEAARSAAGDNRRRAHQLGMALVEMDLARGDRAGAEARLRDLADSSRAVDANEARLMLAELSMAEGRSTEARALAQTVLDSDSDNVTALAIRASFRIDDYDIEGALSDLRTATNRAPENPRLFALVARAHVREGRPDLAAAALATAARVSNMAPAYALPHVRNLLSANDVSAAEAVLLDALRRHPESLELLAAMGDVQIERADWRGAEQTATRLAALSDGEALASRLRANALTRRGRLSEAISLLEGTALESAQGQGSVATQLAISHLQAGNVQAAIQTVERRLAEEPEDLTALLLRAELHLRQNDIDGAEARLREMIDSQPDRSAGYVAMARLRGVVGNLPGAEAILAEGVTRTVDPAPAHFLLAQIYETRGNIDGAIAQYEALYAINSDSFVVANNLASLLSDHRSDDPASVERAIRIAQRLQTSDVPAFQDTYGWLLFLRGDAAAAQPFIERAVAGLPNNPIVRYHMGRIYAALGRSADARIHLEAALAASPDFPLAASALATLSALDVPAQ